MLMQTNLVGRRVTLVNYTDEPAAQKLSDKDRPKARGIIVSVFMVDGVVEYTIERKDGRLVQMRANELLVERG